MPEPEPIDDAKSDVLELQVLHRVTSTGRPLFLTARRFIRICHWIEKGESASEACRIEQVTYQGFRKHIKRNPKYAKRLKEAEAVREQWFREFHIANIVRHAPKNVLASLWWMERRFPSEFALRTVHRPDTVGDAKPTAAEIPSEVLAHHRRLMLAMAREDEAREAGKIALDNSNTQ